MKWLPVLIFFFFFTKAEAQNEFTATAFYKDFKKIVADGQKGFSDCKGSQRKTGFEDIVAEYRCKCLLSQADSGRILFPVSSNPYAVYYFHPDKVRLKIDQQGADLREAIMFAFEKPLYSRSETYLVNNRPFTNTLYFTDPNENKGSLAVFRQCIYYNNDGKYMMSIEIRGKAKD